MSVSLFGFNREEEPFQHISDKDHSLRSLKMNGSIPQSTQSSSTNWAHTQFMPPTDMSSIHCLFKCSECQIAKSSCEDLEVHIKIEHLNWLPFCCMLCNAKRASDNQIREHTYSHHKKTDHNKYIYIDNPKAKSQLQSMTDRGKTLFSKDSKQ